MALSGNFSNYPVNGFGLYCTWSASQSITGNYSDVTLNVYLKYYTLSVGERTDSKISINGTSETYTVSAIRESTNKAHTTLLKSKTVRVNHESNGTKSGVALSASWRFSGTYSGVRIETITASASVTLDTIDRAAPTVSFSHSSITANGFSISANSSATADIWQYSTDGGSNWTQFSTTAGTSASKTISNLSPNTTYSVKVRARKKSNQVYGTSSAASIKTLGGAVLNSVSTVTADDATVSITLNATVYEASYTNKVILKNGSTAVLTFNSLSWSAGTTNRTITLTAAQRTTLLNSMSTIKSFTGTFDLSSYSGSTQIGSTSSKTATVQTTSKSAPAMGNFTCRDGNATVTAVTGNDQYFLQGYSQLKVTPAAATAKNGATITSYTITCDSLTASTTTATETTVGTITASENVNVMVKVTDSRGYMTSYTRAINVLPYQKLKVSNITLRRTNEIEAEMQLIFNGSFSSIKMSGIERNDITFARYRYKKTNESTYSSYINIYSSLVQSGLNFSYSNLQLVNFDPDSSYDFQLQIRDELATLSSQTYSLVVSQGTPLVTLRKKKVGINVVSPDATLHVGGNVKIGNDMLADFIVEQGTRSSWQYRKWASGKAECWCRVDLTGVAITSTWGGLYASGSMSGSKKTFPFTFTSVPMVYFSSDATGMASILMRGGSCAAATTEHTGTIEAVRANSQTGNVSFNYYAVGNWK